MKAVVYRKYGSPDVLHMEDVDKPIPKDGEILVRVRARPCDDGDGRRLADAEAQPIRRAAL